LAASKQPADHARIGYRTKPAPASAGAGFLWAGSGKLLGSECPKRDLQTFMERRSDAAIAPGTDVGFAAKALRWVRLAELGNPNSIEFSAVFDGFLATGHRFRNRLQCHALLGEQL
jgi:hypothetical protein